MKLTKLAIQHQGKSQIEDLECFEILSDEDSVTLVGGAYVVGFDDDGRPGIYQVQGERVGSNDLSEAVTQSIFQIAQNPTTILSF